MAVMAAQHTTVCLDNVSKGKFVVYVAPAELYLSTKLPYIC